jgi:F1F0 ATPase subunit 2
VITQWFAALGSAMHGFAALALGALVGTVHFASLQSNVRLFVAGRGARALVVQLARVVISVAVMVAMARFGAWILVCAALGWLLARRVAIRAALRRLPDGGGA